MPQPNPVSAHYTQGNLLQTIHEALDTIGKSPNTITIEDLAPIDEFHIGGRTATKHLLDQLGIPDRDQSEHHLLDVGCGVGGPARFVAQSYGCRVTGIDLTSEFVETGAVLCQWVGLDQQVTLQQGSALELSVEGEPFNGAYMLHVGMNIEDKAQLFADLYRVLRPGARFGVYDVMQTGDRTQSALAYPLPWATVAETSHLATPEEYKLAMSDAGFTVVTENNRREFALATFEAQRLKNQEHGGPPPIGLHTLIGESIGVKIKNMVGAIADGKIAPIEIVCHK